MNAASTLSSVQLPGHIAHALRQVAAELRHMPREAVTDKLELLHWLNRQARHLDEIAASRMLDPPPPVVMTTIAALPPAPPCQACEARRRRPHRRGAVSGQLALPFLDRETGTS